MSSITDLEQIGKFIKDRRTSKNLTQGDLAKAAGVRLATISDIELGKLDFKIDTLLRIATALDCQICVPSNK
jgi:transcriptional regulator with XRE-family HTH domain